MDGALPPPAGFGLPDEKLDVEILAGTAVTTFIALTAVGLRFWVRSRIVRSLGWDDYWILAAFVLSLIGFCIIIPEVQYGAGRHVFYILQDLGPAGLIRGLKLNFITQFTYVFALAFVKVSIGLFLLRLTPTNSKTYKIIIYGVLGFLAFYTLGGSAALMAGCRPFAANFDRTVPGASCYAPKTSQALAFTNSSLGILTDLIFAFLPLPLLWKLQINKRVKLSIIGILSLGLFAASASVVKLYYLTGYGQFGDFLWDSTYLTIWSATEVNVGIIAASIPALKPLFKTILGSTYGHSSYPGYPSQKRGYAHHSSGHNDHLSSNMSKSRNKNANSEGFEMNSTASTAVVSGKSGDRERNKLGVHNLSEESILPLQSNAARDGKGIMKTTHVFVKTDEIGTPRSVEDRV